MIYQFEFEEYDDEYVYTQMQSVFCHRYLLIFVVDR